jgi:hypothetical protein
MNMFTLSVRHQFSARQTGIILTFLALFLSSALLAQDTQDLAKETRAEDTKKLVEIYRVAPGKHEEFLRFVAYLDDINIEAGLPPRELYVHNDGADWDFIIIQPAATPPEFSDAYAKAWEEAGAPSGANFFFHIRTLIAEHTDTFATGPITAREFLSGVESDSDTE